MRFEGRSALVTGGASGIGLAAVRRLVSEGATVAAVDRGADAADTLQDLGVAILAVDISHATRVAEVIGGHGVVDVLVNCAGWDRAMPFMDTELEFWREVLDINLLGPIAVTHAVLRAMPDGGAIVNVASDAGRVGSSGEVVYSAAKGGVIAFTKALAREVARRGIRVNAVAPGPTETPFLDAFDESGELAEAMKRQTPLRKLGTADEVAAAICFLASDDASHITGQVLSVSGGLTMV